MARAVWGGCVLEMSLVLRADMAELLWQGGWTDAAFPRAEG